MNRMAPPAELLLQAAQERQGRASDPEVSAWVRANAGTGKTHVLVRRILRLLLNGADPRSILCLTYTKNAAAEMESRVLADLGKWATADEAHLSEELTKLLGRAPLPEETNRARCLFASVVDAPGGLAMMTIHAFCERVLRRFSLEANVPHGFSVMTEDEARQALREATLSGLSEEGHGSHRESFETIVAYAGGEEFEKVLSAALAEKSALFRLLNLAGEGDPVALAEKRLRVFFGLSGNDAKHTLFAAAASSLDPRLAREAVALLAEGSASDQGGRERFEAALAARGEEARFDALCAAFRTKDGKPRASLMTAGLKKRAPALHEALLAAQQSFVALDDKLRALKAVEATTALLRIAAAIFDKYEAAKRSRSALDFNDLIDKTLSLLSRAEAAEWVLYQLDARIDHILVDEAQDTAPAQWRIIEKLTGDFFAGEGRRDFSPTIFAVGDEKQSIYGFQGAAPELLAINEESYRAAVREAGFRWQSETLDLSFRSLSPVLSAVDDVARLLPSLCQEDNFTRHFARRADEGGLVEIWEPVAGERRERPGAWDDDSEDASGPSAAQLLAERIARRIRQWLDRGEVLASRGRAIEPGDILILLRKRNPMASLLQQALKREGIPVAGADRVALLETLAVMDLLALADAVLQPEDDLALATVLKSPLFGLDEDQLFQIASGRKGSLWESLTRAAETGAQPFARAFAKLAALRVLAASASAREFFAHVLGAAGGRMDFAARLGPECHDALDEFLSLAADFTARRGGHLSEFVPFIRQSASEVKRETEKSAREVRIMTVHGAKGLEADIVFLADTCAKKGASDASFFFLDDPVTNVRLPIWAIKSSGQLPQIVAAKNARKEAADREAARLLYVAMTRARDRLYIAGSHQGSGVPDGSWYDIISNALQPRATHAEDWEGRRVWRIGDATSKTAVAAASSEAAPPLPAWADSPPMPENAARVLAASKLVSAAPSKPIARVDRDAARAEGNLVHRLLELLPMVEGERREALGRAIADADGSGIPSARRAALLASVLAIFEDKDLGPLFSGGLAEAGLALSVEKEDGSSDIILGQGDRIVFGEKELSVVDYKSGRLAEGDRPLPAHLAQLAAYRAALERIFPGKPVGALLLKTASKNTVRAQSRELDTIIADLRGARARKP